MNADKIKFNRMESKIVEISDRLSVSGYDIIETVYKEEEIIEYDYKSTIQVPDGIKLSEEFRDLLREEFRSIVREELSKLNKETQSIEEIVEDKKGVIPKIIEAPKPYGTSPIGMVDVPPVFGCRKLKLSDEP